jgi:hypothetical protein
MSDTLHKPDRGITSRIVELFITSKLSLLLLIASFLAGFAALALTPARKSRKSSCRWPTSSFPPPRFLGGGSRKTGGHPARIDVA